MTRTIAIFLELPESAELIDDIADDAADDADDAADDSTIILLYGYIIIWEV